MVKHKKIKESIAETKQRENLQAIVAKQEALIDYLAMMADIEIPTEEDEQNV